MRVDLLDLLASRDVSSPSWIRDVSIRNGVLSLVVEGWAWWRPEKHADGGQIRLNFSGISSGTLDILDLMSPENDDDDDEALEVFDVLRTSDLEWTQGPWTSVYCYGPLLRPLDLYDRVEAYLDHHKAVLQPSDILNGAERLSRFLTYAASNAYLLSSAPKILHELIMEELKQQGVPYQLWAGGSYREAPIFVRLGECRFFCKEAWAEFD